MSQSSLPTTIVNAAPSSAPIAYRLREIEGLLDDMFREAKSHVGGNPVELARAFVATHRIKDVLADVTKAFNAQYEVLKTETVPKAFEDAGVPNVPLSEGFRVQVSAKLQASICPDRKADAYEWLRANQLGDLITETVNTQTLSAAAKAMLEEDNRELPELLFNVAVKDNTSVVAAKAKK